MIEVLRAPAFATVQDLGRDGWRRSGVPPGGAMDRLSLRLGNTLLGNAPDSAAIEWALTGGSLRFHRRTVIVLTGANATAHLAERPLERNVAAVADNGDILEVEALTTGRFLYVCVAGGIDVPRVLGGRGTYLPAAFGGFHGRRLAVGDALLLGGSEPASPTRIAVPSQLDTLGDDSAVVCVPGPQRKVLSDENWSELLATGLVVAAESDRAGYRLHRSHGSAGYSADAHSEPSCVGAVQLTPDGNLVVLMPDGPTVGGYPKIAVVAACDLPRLAQKNPGATVTLRMSEPHETRRRYASQLQALEDVATLTSIAPHR